MFLSHSHQREPVILIYQDAKNVLSGVGGGGGGWGGVGGRGGDSRSFPGDFPNFVRSIFTKYENQVFLKRKIDK